ncbi:hypothetical protein JP0144_02460 [Helicobacter pylori]
MDALMLPLNWQRVRLGDIAEIKRGVRITKNELDVFGKYPVVSGGVGFLGYTNNFNRYENTITIAQYGTAGYVNFQKNKFWANDVCFCIYPNKDIIKNIFLYYFLKVNQNYLYEISNRNATPYSISKDKILDFEIPLPPLNEQIAIANILSALDRYLYALDALVLKKEGVKKALSFELLSQRKRLKGFNQAWQRVKLGDICEFGNGGVYETLIVENGDFKLISLNSIDIDGNLKNTMKRVNFYDNSLKQDDIVMVLSDVVHGDFLGLCAVIPSNDYVLNQRMGRLRIRNDCINILFLRLYINANQKYFKMQGQGSSQLNLSKKAIEDFEILLPPLNEQNAIAKILSALDNEIASLKNKKRQFENIKKALNHDLMSAKIRVLEK